MQNLLIKKPLIALITVVIILQTVVICYYNFNGFFGQDSYEYLRITRSLNAFYTTGTEPAYTVYPIMYPIVCSIVNIFIPDTMVAMQLVSIISLVAATIFMVKILKRWSDVTAAIHLYVLLFFVVSPYLLRFSIIAMSDMFCIAMWLASLFYSLKFESGKKMRHLLLATLFAGIAVITRYPAAVMLLLPVWICTKTIISTKKYYYLLLVLMVALICTIPDLVIRQRFIFWNIGNHEPAFSYDFFANQFSINNLFQRNFYNIDGHQHYDTPNIIFGLFQFFHPAFIFCGLVFLLLLFKKHNRHSYTIPIIIVVLLYTLFIGCNPYQNNRYLMFALPAVLLVYYLPFSRLIMRFNIKGTIAYLAVLIVFIIQILLFTIGFRATVQMNKSEAVIAKYVHQLPVLPVYTLGIDGALSAYNPEIEIINLYNTTLTENNTVQGYILYNNIDFPKQFAGLLPETNFQFLKSRNRLRQIENFTDGWVLYQID